MELVEELKDWQRPKKKHDAELAVQENSSKD
jgi:hypothetical protein